MKLAARVTLHSLSELPIDPVDTHLLSLLEQEISLAEAIRLSVCSPEQTAKRLWSLAQAGLIEGFPQMPAPHRSASPPPLPRRVAREGLVGRHE
jgi:hypothetical protein